ncbi:exo-alpha-sialidase [Massilia sp. ST3]|uniref:WD40/YVTN/BNR-like repeat-containing protein n=1 Tax=Massilia sp. ST3 TaxID=2824903 RepID=UPI001B8133DB|nr:exo-alpha-sialidase [Massilia sp. ST3]MBQ5945953.1 exo-alpha-sialidase [Massilia sp. ST3]
MKFLKQAGGLAIALTMLTGASPENEAPVRVDYVWDSVAIGGGGFVTAVLPSRSEPGVAYARTDVGGAYRWDAKEQRWWPLMDWVAEDQTGFLGIDALAIDPRHAGRIYLLAGISYLNGGRTAILRSLDYGKSFTTIDVSSQFKTHGNGMGRQNGERLAVDPGNGDMLYLGSRRDGLFFSSDAGERWTRLESLPVTTTPNDVGINVVVPDPASVANGRARRLFVAVSRFGRVAPNLYRSDDGGVNFAPVAGAPRDLMPQRAVLDGAGNLYLTYADGAGPHPDRTGTEPMRRGQVWRYNIAGGAWTNVTPQDVTHPFAGISIDPRNPRRIVVSTINTFLPQGDAKGDRVYVSEDGGDNWIDVIARGFRRDAAGVPWLKGHGIHWTGSVEFDPQDPRAVWITSGNGVFRTPDIQASPANWVFTVKGMEETVPLGFLSIPGGPLVSAIGDIDGYLHEDPSRHGRIHEPQIGTTTGLDAAAAKPSVMVRVGKHMMLTRDGGAHWTQTRALMGIKGQAALSADGATILHNPERSAVTYRSVDMGASWTAVKGLSKPSTLPVADPVRPGVFYAYDDGAFLASTDGGASFAPRASLPAGGSRLVRAAPGREGDLWVALKAGGLVRSLDGGTSFTALEGIDYCGAVGFGKAAPGASYLTIYIWGARKGVRGIYRSLDGGKGWDRINDERHQYGGPGDGHFIVGDMNRFGYVYMSTAGRGIVYGRPGAK